MCVGSAHVDPTVLRGESPPDGGSPFLLTGNTHQHSGTHSSMTTRFALLLGTALFVASVWMSPVSAQGQGQVQGQGAQAQGRQGAQGQNQGRGADVQVGVPSGRQGGGGRGRGNQPPPGPAPRNEA